MDYLWTPWRYRYIASAKESKGEGCIFCELPAAQDDAKTLIVYRGEKNFVILNRFPYTTGHLMVVPYQHIGDLAACDPETLAEMMRITQHVKRAMESTYRPEGYNLGMNLGRAAGAGITEHLHLHFLPRWTGDSNFMTAVAETRLEPEDLTVTYDKLRKALAANA